VVLADALGGELSTPGPHLDPVGDEAAGIGPVVRCVCAGQERVTAGPIGVDPRTSWSDQPARRRAAVRVFLVDADDAADAAG